MKLKILGCSGSEAIGHNPPGLLVNDVKEEREDIAGREDISLLSKLNV